MTGGQPKEIMIQISPTERKTIEGRFPNAEIVATKHHFFLCGYEDTNKTIRFLRRLRSTMSPPNTKERYTKKQK